jgi:hypothetical protein
MDMQIQIDPIQVHPKQLESMSPFGLRIIQIHYHLYFDNG